MRYIPLPSVERLRELYSYNPLTGVLVNRRLGRRIASSGARGYVFVRIDGFGYLGSRVIWKMMTGRDPIACVDHKNLNCGDNRWENLREATHTQNAQNQPAHRRSRSGLKGATHHKTPGGTRWRAHIHVNGKRVELGTFKTAEEAHEAYKAAALHHFGEFARF